MRGSPVRNSSPLKQGTGIPQKNSVGLENEEDIFERIWGVNGYFSAGRGFKARNGNGTIT